MLRRCLIALVLLSGAPSVALAGERELVVYSAGPNRLIRDLAEDFQRLEDVRVRVLQGTTGQILARLESERRNPQADVVISASWGSAGALRDRDLLLAYSPEGADKVPDAYRDPYFTAQGLAALGIVWNRHSGTPRPAHWEDLTDPAYRGQVTLPDPAQSGTALQLLNALLTERGEEATWALFAGLRDNGALVPGPNARALNPVLQGARAVVFGAVDYIALNHRARGEAVELIFPEEGTTAAPRPMMIMASTPRPELARRFLDHVLSPQGQRRVAEAFLIPARRDVPAQRPGFDELKLIEPEAGVGGGRGAVIERFREVMQP